LSDIFNDFEALGKLPGLRSSGHDSGHFAALYGGIFSGQFGLFRGYKKISFLRKMTQ